MSRPQAMTIGSAFAEAMKAYEEDKPALAQRLAHRLAEAHPRFGGAHYLLGLLALDQGRGRQAANHLARAITITPDQPALHFTMARALEQSGDANAAILHYRRVLAADPQHADAHFRLGNLLFNGGRVDEAVSHYRRSTELNPGHAEAQMALGAALLKADDPVEAAQHLRHALELRPDWPAALNNYGLSLRRLGRLEQAQMVLAGAIELDPNHGGFRANMAATLRAMGRLGDAADAAETASRVDPRCTEAWLELGLARKAQGHSEGAAAAFERAATLAPTQPHIHWCLGEAERALARNDIAAHHYKACLELDPEDRYGARLGLALAGAVEPPDKASPAYVRHLFDEYAETFEASLVEKLGYRGPELIAKALARSLAPAHGGVLENLEIMDAGCGTGLAATVLRPLARRLDGADLSPAMAAKAVETGLYDDVAVGDLLEILEARPRRYDLVVAADVLIYMGDLAPVMKAAYTALKDGGAFAFTVEATAERGATYHLGAKSRYAHSADYIRSAAETAGLSVLMMENAPARREAGMDVPGLVAVAGKPASR